jgi:hypothetical protein
MKTRSETFIGRSRAMRAVPPPPFPVFERSSGTTSAVVVGCRALVGCFSGVLQPVLVRPGISGAPSSGPCAVKDNRRSIVKLAVELKECKC